MSADVSLLAEVPLFSLLDDEERAELARHVEVVHVAAGQHVFRHGDPGDSIYIIRSGKIETYCENNAGEKIVLATAEFGDFFGELSFLDNSSRSASVLVLEDLEAIVLDRNDLHELIHHHPHAALDILASIGTRFRQMLEQLQFAHTRNANKEFDDTPNFGERIADKVATFGGSWTFIGVFALVMFVWILVNASFIMKQPFDPYPYILLNLVLSCLAAIQAPVIMMSQNRQNAKDRIRSDIEYEVNLRAELEINHLHTKLDRISCELLRASTKNFQEPSA